MINSDDLCHYSLLLFYSYSETIFSETIFLVKQYLNLIA